MSNTQKPNYLNTILLVFLILIGLVLLYKTCNRDSGTPVLPQPSKTDSIKVDYFPEAGKIPSDYVPIKPEVVILYRDRIDTFTKVVRVVDTFYVINTFTVDTFGISKSFLTNFPKNPKLIDGNFTSKAFKFTFMYPEQGRVETKEYPIDLSAFEYMWLNDSLAGKPLSTHSKPINLKPPITTSSWLYVGYNPFTKASKLAIDYAIEYKHLGLFGRGQFSTQTPNWDFQIGGKIRLR